MQKANRHRIYQWDEQNSGHVERTTLAHGGGVGSTTVLVIAGMSRRLIDRALARAAAQSAPNGITLNVFDSLAHLPRYDETLELQRLPRPVAALRSAAVEAQAAMVVTDYYGQIPPIVHNAVDWLTRQWNQSALHDKPLAIIGRTEDGYSGVWSRRQTEDSQRITETRVIEPITVRTLHEAVAKLAEQAKPNACNKGGQRHVPGRIAQLEDGADESEVDRLRRELAMAEARLEELGGDADIA
jgi:NAD(P)H-dependent FMN reductase